MPRLNVACGVVVSALFAAAPIVCQTPTAAATPAPKPSPCLDAAHNPEFRQLDFWVGAWEVFNKDGKKLSDVTISKVVNDCGLAESWKSTRPGGDGVGLSTYNARSKKWEYFWVSGGGTTSHFEGSLLPDEMRFRTVQQQPDGTLRLRHWSLIKLPGGKVRELSVGSADDGVTWSTEYDYTWTPKS